MQLSARITGLEQFRARNAALAKELNDGLFEELRAQGRDTKRRMQQDAPVFRGILRQRIRARTSHKRLTSRVRATARHSWLVAHGRRPGKGPRPEALREWAAARGLAGKEFVLARAIARKGTRAHPYQDAALAAAQTSFPTRIRAVVDRVITRYRAS